MELSKVGTQVLSGGQDLALRKIGFAVYQKEDRLAFSKIGVYVLAGGGASVIAISTSILQIPRARSETTTISG